VSRDRRGEVPRAGSEPVVRLHPPLLGLQAAPIWRPAASLAGRLGQVPLTESPPGVLHQAPERRPVTLARVAGAASNRAASAAARRARRSGPPQRAGCRPGATGKVRIAAARAIDLCVASAPAWCDDLRTGVRQQYGS
jgi:hypothetical protein